MFIHVHPMSDLKRAGAVTGSRLSTKLSKFKHDPFESTAFQLHFYCGTKLSAAGLDYEGTCHLRVYVHYFGLVGSLIALALAPYVPRFREKMCFLDVVSIHQADEDDLKRGIYAIGGFLAVSSELQIFWDQEYLEKIKHASTF